MTLEGARENMTQEITVRFWGVRGSIACPGPEYVTYGGNTSCIEVNCGDTLLILDAGTGLRPLGKKLVKSGKPIKGHLLLTHTHYDHVEGLPFFEPLYTPDNRFTIYAGHLKPPETIQAVLSHMMREPLFPVPLDIFDAQIHYYDFEAGDEFVIEEHIDVKTQKLNHPNGACGYRINYAGKSICYITDTEHQEGHLDQNILTLIKDADLLIYDATYMKEDYQNYQGWGHSTSEAGYELALAAGVKHYVLFHHNPDYDDEILNQLAHRIKGWEVPSHLAREGQEIII